MMAIQAIVGKAQTICIMLHNSAILFPCPLTDSEFRLDELKWQLEGASRGQPDSVFDPGRKADAA